MHEKDLKIKRAARTVILDNQGKIAIINVRNGEYFKIPGGGIEMNETPEEAVKREALEEAGAQIEIIEKLGEQKFQDPYAEFIHHSVCFLSNKIGAGKNPEFDNWEKNNNLKLSWINFDEAIKLFQSSATKDPMGKEINKRDYEFLLLAIKKLDKIYPLARKL